MQIEKNISLKSFNTFGIDAKARYFASISSIEDLIAIYSSDEYSTKFVLGGGSNMLLTQDLDALVLHIDLKGIEVVSETEDRLIVKANAGENWHEFVLWCLSKDYGGLENLSLIPGNVGSSPIQNIGAYGVELKDRFHSCEALNLDTLNVETFYSKDCAFDYRNSVFKQDAKGKYIITSVSFALSKTNHILRTEYGAIKDQLEQMNITEPCIKDVSDAVIAIRQTKLPDPKEIGNSGSFFKNPIVSTEAFHRLQNNFPEVPHYPISKNEVKIPAGWLIETAGFKGKTFGNYGVHKNQALVLVNYGGASGKDILELSKLIQKTVKRLFDISIEAEVNII